MNEEMTNATETTETTEAFLEGWDDADSPISEEIAQEPEPEPAAEQQQEQPAEEHPADQPVETAEKPAEAQQQEQQSQPDRQQEAPRTWKLRHLDQEKEVNEQELTSLAQKGLDYDRIREKYDETKPLMDLFSQFANKAGMSTKEYVAFLRQEAKKAQGMNEAEAKRAVDLEDREAAVAAKEAADAEKAQEQQAAEAGKADAERRRQADILEFQKTFPEAAKDPKNIPPEVWESVRNGNSLTVSFALWQVKQSKAEAEQARQNAAAAQQNERNASRSTGSMKSAGEENKSKDPFLQGWDS